jgi:hypothetical protein
MSAVAGGQEAAASGAGDGTGDAETGEEVEQAPGVTVVPATFRLVAFDAVEIAEIAATWRRRVGIPAGLPIRIEVNERTPLGRANLASVEPAVLEVESGALENAHRPRRLSQRGAAEALGRLLLRLRDRLDPGFADAPDEDDLTLALTTAWDIYAIGRLGRLGLSVQRPRWLYHYRLRHGFTDAVDAAFTQLWTADGLTWAELEQISTTSAASTNPA